jgi:hypothetical protein
VEDGLRTLVVAAGFTLRGGTAFNHPGKGLGALLDADRAVK